MARIRIEPHDPERHSNHMPEVDACEVPGTGVLVVEVGRHRLEFWSGLQLEAAIAWFENPVGSTRRDPAGGDHWEYQPWQARLPKGMVAKRNRGALMAALHEARGILTP